ncbi:MAG: putative nucleotide-diphospho-sugar transferase [Verrucomicrobiota bacterium]
MKVLTSVTPVYGEICERWLEPSLRRSNPDVVLEVVVDSSAEAAGNGDFRSAGFDAHVANKMGLIAEWARTEGEPFLVTDADIVYFQPLEPILAEILGDADILLAREWLGEPHDYNIGQMVVRPGPRTSEFFLQVEAVLRAGRNAVFGGDQPANQLVLNQMIRESGLNHGFLPPVFANGAIFEQLDAAQRLELVSYHATASFPQPGRTSIEIKHQLLAEAVYAVRFRGERGGEDDDLGGLDLLAPPGPRRRMLVVGAGNGRIVFETLTHLFPDTDAEVHAMGHYVSTDQKTLHHPQARETLLRMVEECCLGERVHFYDGEISEALAWMISEEGFWETFAMVWLESADSPAELLLSACGAWNLIQPGGCIVWVKDRISSAALDSFLSAFWDRAEIIFDSHVMVLRKHARPTTTALRPIASVPRVEFRPACRRVEMAERENGLSAVLLNWNRPENVHRILDGWRDGGLVTSATVWNNQPGFEIRHDWARVVNVNEDFGLYSRFAAALLAPDEAVWIQDDDLEFATEALQMLLAHWRNDPEILHGVFGRAPKADGSYAEFTDDQEAEVPVVLTRGLIASRCHFTRFFEAAGRFAGLQCGAVPAGNGEDIILSYSSCKHAGRPNRVHSVAYQELPSNEASAISLRGGWEAHLAHRSNLMRAGEEWIRCG